MNPTPSSIVRRRGRAAVETVPPTVPIVPLVELSPSYRCVLVSAFILALLAAIFGLATLIIVKDALTHGDVPSIANAPPAVAPGMSPSSLMREVDAFRKRQASP